MCVGLSTVPFKPPTPLVRPRGGRLLDRATTPARDGTSWCPVAELAFRAAIGAQQNAFSVFQQPLPEKKGDTQVGGMIKIGNASSSVR